MAKILKIIAVIIVVILIGAGVVTWLNNRGVPGADGPGAPAPSPENSAAPEPAWCPDVQVISVPGTWESSSDDDPFNPSFNPYSFMKTITDPIAQSYDIGDVRVWTTPYAAQFRNVNSMGEKTYDESRAEGTARVNGEMEHVHNSCPSTDFILSGFSQGAVIVGDIAHEIGAGNGVVPAEKIRGVAIIADGRREAGKGINPGAQVHGVGAEIALEPVSALIQFVVPGATMTGAREGNFGALEDRTYQICAPNDHICDAPPTVDNAVERALTLVQNSATHAQYATNPEVIPGTTTTEWTVNWMHGLINQ